MTQRVAVIGIGTTGFRATSSDVSYRELTYEAATKAYLDAGIMPKDVDAFVATAEDFFEGYSITDEYSPDQLGAVLRPIYTVPGDFIQSLASCHMMILSGVAKIAAAQGMSKASNMLTLPDMVTFAMDPLYNRALKESPHAVAGMEMARFMHDSGATREQCAKVVLKNRRNALDNPIAAHGANLELSHVTESEPVALPLRKMDVAQHADGAVVVVLAEEETARRLSRKPVWLRGIGWCSDTPGLETRNWGEAVYARLAGDMAYKMAGITCPSKEIDFAEINDEYSYKELQHMEALRLCKKGEAGQLVELGVTDRNGELPINASGGHLGIGNMFDMNGGLGVLEVVKQIRGEAGKHQLKKANVGLTCSWRGVPTTTGAVAVLGNL